MSLNCCCGSCYDNNERLCCCDWSKLPDDLMAEILCRLPEKPLIQFKCVSKAWYFLISSVCVPRISASAPRAGFLVQWTTFHGGINSVKYEPSNERGDVGLVESYSAVLPFQPTAEDFLDCCNGLLLFVKRFSVPAEYYVCNPATKQCIAIPVCPTHLESMYAALDFDPLDHSPGPNYKIIRLNHSGGTASPSGLDVFSSVTGKWVNHPVPLEPELFRFNCAYHYVPSVGVVYVSSTAIYLLSFDLKVDNLNPQSVKLPLPKKDRPLDSACIGVSKGCFYYANLAESKVLVWSLELNCGKAGQWILKHSICKDHWSYCWSKYQQCISVTDLFFWFMPRSLHPESEVFYFGIPWKVFDYHVKNNQFKVFCKLEDDGFIITGQMSSFPYSRCLVVLNDRKQRRSIS